MTHLIPHPTDPADEGRADLTFAAAPDQRCARCPITLRFLLVQCPSCARYFCMRHRHYENHWTDFPSAQCVQPPSAYTPLVVPTLSLAPEQVEQMHDEFRRVYEYTPDDPRSGLDDRTWLLLFRQHGPTGLNIMRDKNIAQLLLQQTAVRDRHAGEYCLLLLQYHYHIY